MKTTVPPRARSGASRSASVARSGASFGMSTRRDHSARPPAAHAARSLTRAGTRGYMPPTMAKPRRRRGQEALTVRLDLNGAFAGTVQQSSTPSATAQPAKGGPATSLALVSSLGPDRGKAQIKIDGQLMATVDLYSPTQTTGQVVWSINGLAPGVDHNLQVVATGTRNVAASAANVDYDAVISLH